MGNSNNSNKSRNIKSQGQLTYDLNETDWLYICDYLDDAHTPPILWLTSSSYASSWVLLNRSITIPWVLNLFKLDVELDNKVVEMVRHGTLALIR